MFRYTMTYTKVSFKLYNFSVLNQCLFFTFLCVPGILTDGAVSIVYHYTQGISLSFYFLMLHPFSYMPFCFHTKSKIIETPMCWFSSICVPSVNWWTNLCFQCHPPAACLTSSFAGISQSTKCHANLLYSNYMNPGYFTLAATDLKP